MPRNDCGSLYNIGGWYSISMHNFGGLVAPQIVILSYQKIVLLHI